MAGYILEFVDQRPVLELTAPGPQGATGAGIVVRDELASTANLPPLPNPNLLPGDAYIIAGELWVYTAAGEFVNTGFVEGAPGPQGIQGIQGVKGDQGIQGVQGVQGPVGPKGDKGDKGDRGQGINVKGTLASADLLPVIPADPADSYIISGDLWVWDSTQWINVGAFRGPQGEQGIQGVAGPQGIQGVKGDTGAQGPIGITGATGATGPKGDIGKSSYQHALDNGFVGTEAQWLASLKGVKGDTGAQGIQGIQGVKGDKGDTGTAGANGKTVVNAAFNATGPVATFVSTQRSYVANAGNLVMSRVSLGTVGSTSTTILIKKNGTTVHTDTVAANNSVITNNLAVPVVSGDYFTIECSSAGTGASDLTVALRVEES